MIPWDAIFSCQLVADLAINKGWSGPVTYRAAKVLNTFPLNRHVSAKRAEWYQRLGRKCSLILNCDIVWVVAYMMVIRGCLNKDLQN